MHSEYCVIPQETADLINRTRASGGRVICVGTTSCRTIESWANEDGTMEAKAGWTNIFIYPGYKFKCLDALVTNFHLPESTLIMLVSALAGRDNVLNAYNTAKAEVAARAYVADAAFVFNAANRIDTELAENVAAVKAMSEEKAAALEAMIPTV